MPPQISRPGRCRVRCAMGNARSASRAASTYAGFVRDVAETGDFSIDDAQRYAVAVVATLEEKLSVRDVNGLEAQLPTLLREKLAHEPIMDLPYMDRALLCGRVASRLGISDHEAAIVARAVLEVLGVHISRGELRHLAATLPSDLASLLH